MRLDSPSSSAAALMIGVPWQSGRYYWAPPSSAGSSLVLTKDTERAVAFYVPNKLTVVRIGCAVSGAGDVGSKVRLGIRADDGTGRPGTLLVDAGVIAGDNAIPQEITISLVLNPNVVYWATAASQIVTVTAPTIVCVSGLATLNDGGTSMPTPSNSNYGRSQSSITGALPSPWTDAGTTQNVPRIFLKAA